MRLAEVFKLIKGERDIFSYLIHLGSRHCIGNILFITCFGRASTFVELEIVYFFYNAKQAKEFAAETLGHFRSFDHERYVQ